MIRENVSKSTNFDVFTESVRRNKPHLIIMLISVSDPVINRRVSLWFEISNKNIGKPSNVKGAFNEPQPHAPIFSKQLSFSYHQKPLGT